MSTNEDTLARVAKLWHKVYSENESEKDLVSENDWANWENMRDKTHPFIIRLLESEYSVTDDEAQKLEDLENTIKGARHVSRNELEVKAGIRVDEKAKKKRRGLLGLFSSK